MSKAKFEAARELIQAQQYDQARALLRTIDDPRAAEWLAKLDKLDPPPVKRKQRPLLALLLVVLAIVILIAGWAYVRETVRPAGERLGTAVYSLGTIQPTETVVVTASLPGQRRQ